MPWGGAFEQKLSAQFKCPYARPLPPPSSLTLMGTLIIEVVKSLFSHEIFNINYIFIYVFKIELFAIFDKKSYYLIDKQKVYRVNA